jgi:hypothetical protein
MVETVVYISDKLYKYYENVFWDTYIRYPGRMSRLSEKFGIPTNLVYKYMSIGRFLYNHPGARVSARINNFENDMGLLTKLANSGDGWLFRLERILNPELDKLDKGERGVQYNVVDFLKHSGFAVQEYVSIPHGMQADVLAENKRLKLIVEVKAKSDTGSIREAVGQCKYYAYIIKTVTGVEYSPHIAAPEYPISENYNLLNWVEHENVSLLTTPIDWESAHFINYDIKPARLPRSLRKH